MTFSIGKRFTFDAAHCLPYLPPEHKCSRLHGHTYTVEVELAAPAMDGDGFVRDYAELGVVKEWLDEHLDHRNLNDVLFEPTTAEHIAGQLFARFAAMVPELVAVTVRETPNTWATYRP